MYVSLVTNHCFWKYKQSGFPAESLPAGEEISEYKIMDHSTSDPLAE